MAIFQGDLVVRNALLSGIADLRANGWLLDDIFAQCATIASFEREFGYKEIARARKWFEGAEIPVVMNHRADDLRAPCITISLGSSRERTDRASMSDEGLEEELDDTQTIEPTEVRSSPLIVLGPFAPAGYDPATGLITLPAGVSSALVFPDQSVRDLKDGRTYPIEEVVSDSQIRIAAGVTTATFDRCTVVPKYQTMALRRQLSYFDETYNIGLHVAGDPAQLLWLHAIAVFVLLRYKQALLEMNGFELSTFQSSDMMRNEAFETEKVFSRFITLSGVVQQDWVEYISPRVEGVVIAGPDGKAGILVESSEDTPPVVDEGEMGWGTRKQ